MQNSFLCGMEPEYFLKHYWNKKPYLFKGAVPEAKSLGNAKDFLGMSLDPDFETRMVIESGGEYPWQAKLGPFKKNDFKKDILWTLICHNLELCHEDFQVLKRNLHYIPEWHFDDIMVTVSNKGSSVGAHIDDYSVFIIQGAGKRRWLLEENPKHGYYPDLDVRLLKDFNPNVDWVLEPGDMLYLPPNVAHHGISLNESVSYSIGYKSVRYNQLIVNYAMDLMDDLEDKSFCDQKSKIIDDTFLVPKNIGDTIYQDVMALLSDRQKFDNSLLRFLSKPKNEALPDFDIENKDALKILKKSHLKRDPWAKLVARKKSKDQFQISINQIIYSVNMPEYKIIRGYFEKSPLKPFKVSADHLKNDTLLKILLESFKSGVFFADPKTKDSNPGNRS